MIIWSAAERRWRRRRRMALALIALAVALLAGAAATLAHSTKHSAAAADNQSHERFDLVGEGRATGGLVVGIDNTVFPDRLLSVSLPAAADAVPAQFHVIEDGQPVAGITVSHEGSRGTLERFAVSYSSRAAFNERDVEVSVVVDRAGEADVDYAAPAAAPALTANRPKPKSFWVSKLGLVSIGAGAAVLIALALIILLVPRRRRSALRRRVAEFTAPAAREIAALEDRPEPRFRLLERWLAKLSWWPRFSEHVEIARFTRTAIELVVISIVLTIAAAVLVGLALSAPPVGLLMVPLGPLALHSLVRHRLRKQRELFADQLAPHLEELGSAMRAGHGLVSGLTATARAAAEPSRTEWLRVIADEQLGMPLEDAMHLLAQRMDCDEVEQVALVAALHHRTGGNMAEVLDRVSDGVRERAELRRELGALTAQARLSRWVVTALPPVVLAIVELVNPSYLQPLFNTTAGNVVLAIGLLLLITGSLVMRALTEIKV